MSLSTDDVKKIAKLSRIKLTDDEISHYQQELSGILNWIEQLQEVNTDNVPQMTSVAAMSLPMREDKVSDGGYQEDILANSPHAEYGCFVVPKVVE